MNISKKTIMWALVILSLISLGSVKVKAAASPVSAPAEPAAAPGPDCMTVLYNMSDCLEFVTPGSKTKKPSKSCCPEVAGILDSNPICLCKLLGNTTDIGVPIDIKRALRLPSFCNLQTYDISMCSAIGIPVSAPGARTVAVSPAGAPMSRAPTSGAVAGAPTTGVSSALSPTEISPSAAGGTNGALSNAQFNVVAYLVTAGLAMAFIHY